MDSVNVCLSEPFKRHWKMLFLGLHLSVFPHNEANVSWHASVPKSQQSRGLLIQGENVQKPPWKAAYLWPQWNIYRSKLAKTYLHMGMGNHSETWSSGWPPFSWDPENYCWPWKKTLKDQPVSGFVIMRAKCYLWEVEGKFPLMAKNFCLRVCTEMLSLEADLLMTPRNRKWTEFNCWSSGFSTKVKAATPLVGYKTF